jgi:nucleotide-binding universal stress UspA family protein
MAGEIIVGYDGREGSVAALRTATAVAAAFSQPLVIVFGYRPAPIGGEVTDLGRAVRAVGERVTAEAVATAHALEPSVTALVELVDDRPAEAILRAADEYDALMVVVGSTSRGPITGALLGSVTYNVVHRSTRPVLVVPTVAAS